VADRFEDERGVIEDILPGPIDFVTRIFTRKGAIRGNHVHQFTTQWTYIMSGSLLVASPGKQMTMEAGSLVCEPMNVPHAWQAQEDTTVLVFTRGPRSGPAYETDMTRLTVPLLP
jgi:quercetin dioxygenase-like cupin family protein